jgi:uncharacterized Zn-binding protein involved in type VI secretion
LADNVAITAGAGTNVATDERTINATTVQIQRTDEIGSATLANGQVVPTTTAATLVAARETRKRLIVQNVGQCTVYVGIATVTTANGFAIPPQATLTLYTTALVQAIIATGATGANTAYIEEYDA